MRVEIRFLTGRQSFRGAPAFHLNRPLLFRLLPPAFFLRDRLRQTLERRLFFRFAFFQRGGALLHGFETLRRGFFIFSRGRLKRLLLFLHGGQLALNRRELRLFQGHLGLQLGELDLQLFVRFGFFRLQESDPLLKLRALHSGTFFEFGGARLQFPEPFFRFAIESGQPFAEFFFFGFALAAQQRFGGQRAVFFCCLSISAACCRSVARAFKSCSRSAFVSSSALRSPFNSEC